MERVELIEIWRDIWRARREGNLVTLVGRGGGIFTRVDRARTIEGEYYLILITGQRIGLGDLRDDYERVTY